MKKISLLLISLILLLTPLPALSLESEIALDLTHHMVGYLSLLILGIAYVLVILEEQTHLHKSKPVLLAAGIIWMLIAIAYQAQGVDHLAAGVALKHNFLEYSELFFFLLVAMSYINAMIDRQVFDALRYWLVNKGFSYRLLFWITGILAFLISPIADNLTTALIMCAVVMAVGTEQPKFVAIACVNIVVAANAGGAFSPFGDITTLMVWQKDIIEFSGFFKLFLPSVVNFIVPSICMHFSIPKGTPQPVEGEVVRLLDGGFVMILLFILTIITAVSFHNFLHLPPVIGMLTGLGYLKFYSYFLKINFNREQIEFGGALNSERPNKPFNVFKHVAGAEWDTLFFFYGVMMAVGGLGFIGYLSMASEFMYGELGATTANILIGIVSAAIDNIPMMYAVLSMRPDMPEVQWLLVTLTAGVGGSLLSVGSAAGVALMGQARGTYTFMVHLKWFPAILLGYFASILMHFWVNG